MTRIIKPDFKRALSLIEAAKRDLDVALSLKLNENSSGTIIRNIYESFRMLGDALLFIKGVQSQDHIMPINELIKLKVNTLRPLNNLDNLRKLRHSINYYGYQATIYDAKDILDFAEKCFNKVYEEVKKKLKS